MEFQTLVQANALRLHPSHLKVLANWWENEHMPEVKLRSAQWPRQNHGDQEMQHFCRRDMALMLTEGLFLSVQFGKAKALLVTP